MMTGCEAYCRQPVINLSRCALFDQSRRTARLTHYCIEYIRAQFVCLVAAQFHMLKDGIHNCSFISQALQLHCLQLPTCSQCVHPSDHPTEQSLMAQNQQLKF